ncbi:MAG: phosphodiester glycosidase family protein [Muribaculaceae bacterium]|nr:phosphodiester glycosidase family protein [Muribaculaceae bacterium]
MKKFTVLLWAVVACFMQLNAQVELNGTTYKVDTLMERSLGPGVKHLRVRIPDYPLNIFMLEVDMTHPYSRVETTQGKGVLGKTELLADAYNRHKAMGKKPIAGCNASFWCVSSQVPWYNFMPGVPHGAEVVNDTIYVNTNRNGVFDFNGGTVNTASTIITKDGRALVARHEWYGCVKSPKFSADQEIIQVNKCCDYNQLVLFNHARGRNSKFFTYPTGCDYIFLKLKEDSKWAIAKDIKFEVAEIKTGVDDQVLGNYDACLVADGDYKAEMAKLAVGDEVAINTYWFDIDGDRTPIEVENMTEGEAHVMLKGEITNRATADYGAKVYSRTAYGNNADGTKLYMIVIEMATNPEYGRSKGCTATVMCQLWKQFVPDLWNVANMDAGGSAQMLIDGAVVNKTTEATARAVANGMMLFSTAPAEDADVIASLAFEKPNLKTPIYYSTSPNVLGYNKYGELISENVDVTYTCSESVGAPSANGKVIEVGATPGYGTITAHYNGVEVTAPIQVQNSEFAIRLKPMILIDTNREYPIEITTEANGETLTYDPARFTWEIEDETVVSIENGVLKGLAEGTTKIKGTLGTYTDEVTVKVEVAPSPVMNQTWDGWTVTSANLSADAVLSADGVATFSYAGKRKATITLEKDVMIYSLPDSVIFEVTTSTPLNDLTVDIRTSLLPETNEVIFAEQVGLPIGTHKWDLMDYIGGREDIGNYPVNIKKIIYNLSSKSGYVSGENAISAKLYSVYKSYTSGVEAVNGVVKSVNIYPQNGNFVVSASGIDEVTVEVYNISGVVNYREVVTVNGGSAVVSPNLANGMYIIKVTGGGDTAVCKMVVKN